MGTTIGIVLAIIGIALIYIFGADMIARGSRVTFERAVYTARLISIGEEAIKSVCFTQANRDEFLKKLGEQIATALVLSPAEDPIGKFLKMLDPDDNKPSSEPRYKFDLDKAKTGKTNKQDIPGLDKMWLTMSSQWVEKSEGGCETAPKPCRNGTTRVILGTDEQKFPLPPLYVDKLKTQYGSFSLTLGDVRLRPVWFACKTDKAGTGVARAEIVVSMKLSRGTVERRITIDHLFDIAPSPTALATDPFYKRWELNPVWDYLARDVRDK